MTEPSEEELNQEDDFDPDAEFCIDCGNLVGQCSASCNACGNALCEVCCYAGEDDFGNVRCGFCSEAE